MSCELCSEYVHCEGVINFCSRFLQTMPRNVLMQIYRQIGKRDLNLLVLFNILGKIQATVAFPKACACNGFNKRSCRWNKISLFNKLSIYMFIAWNVFIQFLFSISMHTRKFLNFSMVRPLTTTPITTTTIRC